MKRRTSPDLRRNRFEMPYPYFLLFPHFGYYSFPFRQLFGVPSGIFVDAINVLISFGNYGVDIFPRFIAIGLSAS